MLPSLGWLAGAAASAILLRDRLPPAALALFALVGCLPAIIALQRGWVRVLWADRLDRARRDAEAAPNDPGAHYELGVMCALRGEDEAARAAFERARSISPGHAPSTVGLGHLLADNDDLGGALALFEQAAETDPGLFSAHFGAASVQYQREQYARAVAAYERALKVEPNDGFALAGMSRCLLELGEIDRARDAAVKAAANGVTDDDLSRDLRAAIDE